jgi:hypothetical protein
MKHELLPCPFCGGAVSECDESPLYGGSIMHDETECLFKNNLLFHGNIAERWNSRPLEDALRSRIAELENIVANYQAAADGDTHWCAECKMKDERIAELEKRATRLAQEYCELAEVWQKHECNPAPPEEVSNET